MGKLDKYFWTSSRCGRVLFLAAPFGYGPRIAAQTMAGLLKLRIGTWKMNSIGRPERGWAKLVLNFGVVSPQNIDESTFRVWIDCLMWLRGTLPNEVGNYDLLLAESFFNTRDLFLGLPALKQISPLT